PPAVATRRSRFGFPPCGSVDQNSWSFATAIACALTWPPSTIARGAQSAAHVDAPELGDDDDPLHAVASASATTTPIPRMSMVRLLPVLASTVGSPGVFASSCGMNAYMGKTARTGR